MFIPVLPSTVSQYPISVSDFCGLGRRLHCNNYSTKDPISLKVEVVLQSYKGIHPCCKDFVWRQEVSLKCKQSKKWHIRYNFSDLYFGIFDFKKIKKNPFAWGEESHVTVGSSSLTVKGKNPGWKYVIFTVYKSRARSLYYIKICW